MSERTEHPPSTNDDSPRGSSARRAVFGGVAGIALLLGPVVLANVIVPGDSAGDAVETAESETSLVALRRSAAAAADTARSDALVAMRTTTTTAPPTTTTTEPPTTTTTEPPTTTTAPPPPPTESPAPPSTGGG
ncbi:MAG TPA: hypothetical protein VFP06_08260, partial [Acidimicrobiales bacterium]|nr:hypothetical protein [Acidimicrobiales bacterium]